MVPLSLVDVSFGLSLFSDGVGDLKTLVSSSLGLTMGTSELDEPEWEEVLGTTGLVVRGDGSLGLWEGGVMLN